MPYDSAIFALVANIVAQRVREIGIRIALGSTIQKTMLHIGRSGVRTHLVVRLNPDAIVDDVANPLLAAKISLGCLHRYVSK